MRTIIVYLYILTPGAFPQTYGLAMSVKTVVRLQYQRLADSAASHSSLRTPPEGWLRTVRKALGMSGAQLAKKMGVTRARVAQD